MKRSIGIFSSDRVNRYGFRFGTSALETMLRQGWKGSPSFLSHDYHRPVGWSNTIGLYLRPGESTLIGTMSLPETEDEYSRLVQHAAHFFAETLENIPQVEKTKLQERVGKHLSGDEFYMVRECTTVVDEGIAARAFPELFTSEEDKRSLIDIRKLNCIGPGVFEYRGCALFAHRFFRRAQSQVNNLNDRFLTKLFDLTQFDDLEIKIALDSNSIGLVDTYKSAIELEFWWGPKFNNSLAEIPTGVTTHGANDRTRFFHGVDRMEFWWHQQNDIQTLEAEEIICGETYGSRFDTTTGNRETYGCRYVHSMIDAQTAIPYHLDGSVREYDENSYVERMDTKISDAGKNSRYVKLWRVDGPIEIARWKELICHFYRDNHLAGEYLNAEVDDDIEVEPALKDDKDTTPISRDANPRVAPPHIADDFGVQMTLAYRPVMDVLPGDDCVFISNSQIPLSGVIRPAMEFSALDFIKLAKEHLTGPVHIPSDFEWVGHEDMDINLPILRLAGVHANSNANAALTCLWTACEKFTKRSDRHFLTFTLLLNQDEFSVSLSFAGFAESIVTCFPRGFPELQPGYDNVADWLEAICALINQGRETQQPPTAFAGNLLKPDSQFYLERTRFPSPPWVFKFNDAGHMKIGLPPNAVYEAGMFRSGKWRVAPVWIIRKAACSRCLSDYVNCPCKATFGDEDVTINIEDGEFISAVITERSAYPMPLTLADE